MREKMQKINYLKVDIKKDSYLLIDICGTFVKENITFGLLLSHFFRFTFKGLITRFLKLKLSPLRIFMLVLEKFTGYYFLKNLLILLIRVVSISGLE